jgi:hypothetical protein
LLFLLTGSGGDLSGARGGEVLVVFAVDLGLDFLAHGGRSELSCGTAMAAENSAANARAMSFRAGKKRVRIRD